MRVQEFSRDGAYYIKGFLVKSGISAGAIFKDDSGYGDIKVCTFKYFDYIMNHRNTVFKSSHKRHYKYFRYLVEEYARTRDLYYLFDPEDGNKIYLWSDPDIEINSFISDSKMRENEALMKYTPDLKVTPTGQISMSDVNKELGLASNRTITFNDSAVRTLAGKPSGQISMSDMRGKSNLKQYSVTVGDADGDGNTKFNFFGYDKSGLVIAGAGSISSDTIEGSSLKILTVGSMVVDNLYGAYVGIGVGPNNYGKFTNKVDMTINGKTYKLSYDSDGRYFFDNDSEGNTIGLYIKNNWKKTISNISFRWYN